MQTILPGLVHPGHVSFFTSSPQLRERLEYAAMLLRHGRNELDEAIAPGATLTLKMTPRKVGEYTLLRLRSLIALGAEALSVRMVVADGGTWSSESLDELARLAAERGIAIVVIEG